MQKLRSRHPDDTDCAAADTQAAAWESARPAFDPDYYLRTYEDVQQAGIDPFLHYMTQGWTEGRNPSAAFDTKYYLELHADVRHSGMNPLLHYVEFGRTEGRAVALEAEEPPAGTPEHRRNGSWHALRSMRIITGAPISM